MTLSEPHEIGEDSVFDRVITVDGPSGSGKGTICLELALAMGWQLLDSGALYRIVAWSALQRGMNLDFENSAAVNSPDESVLDEGASDKDGAGKADIHKLVAMVAEMNISFPVEAGETCICLDGQVIGDELRSETVSIGASQVAALPEVREALLALQRQKRVSPGLIADGRDMGTVVFPNARLKIYLTASAEERAQRRYKQLKDKGLGVSLRALLASIKERDERDQTRAVSPLTPALDAIIVDSTHLSIEAVVQQILKRAEQCGLLTD
ncbi:MAG: (d)CMP kinase [Pseudomonadales bacterium]|nr:(d)CMP kinase [Pseudomonadales bacterium]